MPDLNEQDFNIVRTQNHFYEMSVTGLLPNTKHNIYFDGEDIQFRTKQFGKDFGDDLISNANGILHIGILMQLPFPRDQNFELPEQQTLSFQTNMFGPGTDPRVTQTVVNYRIIELKSSNGLSYAQFRMKFPLVLTPGPVRTLYPIE
jgi:hypothetical protein